MNIKDLKFEDLNETSSDQEVREMQKALFELTKKYPGLVITGSISDEHALGAVSYLSAIFAFEHQELKKEVAHLNTVVGNLASLIVDLLPSGEK